MLTDPEKVKLRRKILQWASYSQGKSRKEFNDSIKELLGAEGFQIVQELWKEGLIKLGHLGNVTISRKVHIL